MSKSVEQNTSKVIKKEYQRLPCRGCLKSCQNYLRCEGRPWRLPQPD